MSIRLDEDVLVKDLEPVLASGTCRKGIATLAGDPFFVAFFLVSVSQGEGLGEAAVGMIGQEELAARILDLKRQEEEERGHKEQTLDVARELFPEFFDGAHYRHEDSLMGRPYYVAVLEENRARLKREGRYSRLNLYLTTTFGYEVMVVLLYGAVADAIERSPLPEEVRDRVGGVLDGILAEEETHLGVVDTHNGLLAMPREGLSKEARGMLAALETLTEDDYAFIAELAVRHVAMMMERYADPVRYRADIERGAA